MADEHELEAGYDVFKAGFTNGNMAIIPQLVENVMKINGHTNYRSFILSKVPQDSPPDAKRRRLFRMIFWLVNALRREMDSELKLRVKKGEWTDSSAKAFAQGVAGKLLLALFGSIRCQL